MTTRGPSSQDSIPRSRRNSPIRTPRNCSQKADVLLYTSENFCSLSWYLNTKTSHPKKIKKLPKTMVSEVPYVITKPEITAGIVIARDNNDCSMPMISPCDSLVACEEGKAGKLGMLSPVFLSM